MVRERTLKTIKAKIVFILLEPILKLIFFTGGQISLIMDSVGVELSYICL